MSVVDSVYERLLMYMGTVYSGYRLWTWYYDTSGELFYSNCPYAEEFRSIFYLGGCLDYALNKQEEPSSPFLMSDSMGLIWLGEFVHPSEQECQLLVVGPAFCANSSLKNIEDNLKQMELSLTVRRSYAQILAEVPVVSSRDFETIAKIQHYVVLMKAPDNLQLEYQQTANPIRAGEEMDAVNYDRDNFREQMVLQHIRDGSVDYQDFIASLQNHGSSLFAEGKPIRSNKNAAIILTSQCAHAAMDGGVVIRTAKEMEAAFIRQIEESNTYTELINLVRKMMESFSAGVKESRTNHTLSPEIRLCCDYIKKHRERPLHLQELAAEVGYTEYYLSRKFQKEMGIKLLDYIRQVRLDYAKIMLSTTNLSVQEISEKLQFGTRSYFTRRFKEYIGLSPAEFRQRAMGIGGKNNEAKKEL